MAPSTEKDPCIGAYTHLPNLPRADDALMMLRKIASLVRPLMRRRGWHVGTLAEFTPGNQNLLGINVNHGERICIRLRYPRDPTLFKDLDELTDTMLHELTHIVFGPHDAKFHALWNELRDEYTSLKLKGYTGEGFLSEGQRLGGRRMPMHEARRQARVQAERRRALQQTASGSGQRLGGASVRRGADMREVIASAVERRTRITQGCGSGDEEGRQAAEAAVRNGFKTKAEEDLANDRCIAQALWELLQDEEDRKAGVEPELWIRGDAPKMNEAPQSEPAKHGPLLNRNGFGPGGNAPTNGSNGASSSGLPRSSPPPIPHLSKPKSGPSVAASRNDRDWNVLRPRINGPLISETERQIRLGSGETIDLTSSSPTDDRNDRQGPAPSPQPSNGNTNGNSDSSKEWSCTVCTLVNPESFLACDACGSIRTYDFNRPASAPEGNNSVSSDTQRVNTSHVSTPSSKPKSTPVPTTRPLRPTPLGWNCDNCGTFMETQWWTCSLCGKMKSSS